MLIMVIALIGATSVIGAACRATLIEFDYRRRSAVASATPDAAGRLVEVGFERVGEAVESAWPVGGAADDELVVAG
jgi:hypothetical protein